MKTLNRIGARGRHRVSGFLVVTAILWVLAPELEATVLFGRIRECGGTASVAGYVVQGFEVVRAGIADGRECNASDPRTQNVGTDVTDDDGKYSITYTATERSPFHCVFERTAVIKVFLPDGTTLIHTSQKPGGGIGILDSAFPDINPGHPNGCPETRFTFSLDGPSVVSGQPGTQVSFEVTVLLDTEFTGAPGLHGAEGWNVNVAAEGGRVVSATFSGTLAAQVDDDPPGLVTSCGVTLLRVDTAAEGPECANLMVAQSAVGISCVDPPAGLPLEGALPRILRVTVEAVMPAQFTQGVCRVFFPERCAVISPDFLMKNAGFFSGRFIPAVEKRELQVTLRGASPSTLFRRADANGSAEVDISDPVSTLGWLFSGTAEPPCLAAADSNDSGGVDLSDAIYTLTWLFSAGERPPSPGPFDCGSDATPDRLPVCSGTGC